MPILLDVLTPNLKVIFCGTAASTKSAAIGAYYAGPGNRFWPTLYEVGLTPVLLKPIDFQTVVKYGIGLTDMAKDTSGNDSDLVKSDFDAQRLHKLVAQYQPERIAFTSKRAAQAYYGVKRVAYGWQPEKIDETRCFVLPSPSGAARRYWNITYWQQLAADVLNKG